MRHQKNTVKLGRSSKHRESLIANLAVGLITHNRITTTLAKAKAMRPFAEKLITLGKSGSLHHRRLAAAKIGDKEAVKKLFSDVAPRFKDRSGGYTRILKLGNRLSDAADMALIEWVEAGVPQKRVSKKAAQTSIANASAAAVSATAVETEVLPPESK